MTDVIQNGGIRYSGWNSCWGDLKILMIHPFGILLFKKINDMKITRFGSIV